MGTIDSSGSSLLESPYRDEILPATSCLDLFNDVNSRILYNEDGIAVNYYLRSPCTKGNSWQYQVDEKGSIYSYASPYSAVISEAEKEYIYPRIMVSI